MATQKTDLERLIEYIANTPYIPMSEWRKVCKMFNLPYMPKLFRDEYRKRFYNYLKDNTTTVADVTDKTGIPQKYLTQRKAILQKKGKLIVVFIGKCPTTGNNAQFLSTNQNLINSLKK